MEPKRTVFQTAKMLLRREMLFCEINPTCFALSEKKEYAKRHIRNFLSSEKIAKEKSDKVLPYSVFSQQSELIKKGKGIDPETQYNKAHNIDVAGSYINRIVIRPGQTFSFWQTVGAINEKRGYKKGRVIEGGRLITGVGGGLCNLGNVIHLLILHSPLDVTEVHYHSDALAPDHGRRVPMSAGTSVNYNRIDFRFKNNTNADFQLLCSVSDEILFAELRCSRRVKYAYDITEDDHHFSKEGDKYYRISKIYRDTLNPDTAEVIRRDLIRDNHSEVMFDYNDIPKEQIR